MLKYLETIKPYWNDFLKFLEGILQLLPHKVVSIISWVLIAFAMIDSILLSNFVGWATINGLLLEFGALVFLRFLLIHGWNRNEY